ncbi:metal-dependent transcriptional regulator [Streptococcus gallolyticus]|uniref:metal-dependent transcriptional regulator n=1 Tax=Streptococcus hepaticus TaxID=3349163 RepID=UPI001C94FBED|nr:metal-dependent transcriptional regulator [Streptococcus gallolyticus]MBY5040661.1 metal-dependent transcriptional regulator [Streptococcus gallolyticus]
MTPNKEDYLKCIYELGQIGQKMTNKKIAETMQFSAPAVSEMMKKLLAEGLVQKDSKIGYRLEERGQKMVADLYRKHRLIEVFLLNQLGYSAEEVHEEAEVLEHTISDLFVERLDAVLGFPEICPHGGTIPRQGQPLVERYATRLSTITQVGHYRLVRVKDFYQLLQYLEQHELAIGDQLEILEIDMDFSQTVTVAYKDKQLTIPMSIAQVLYVEEEKN